MLLILIGCTNATLTLGQGTGSDFVPIESGDDVLVMSTPQGGNGMQVRGVTTGLQTNATVNCDMYSIVDGVEGESFLLEGVALYGYEDHEDATAGLFWDAVVPLDPTAWPDAESVLDLDGTGAILVVEVTDSTGKSALAEVDVTLVTN
jgi:hypothetical protein